MLFSFRLFSAEWQVLEESPREKKQKTSSGPSQVETKPPRLRNAFCAFRGEKAGSPQDTILGQ